MDDDIVLEEERQEAVNSAEFKKYVGVEAARRALRRNVHFGDNTVVEFDPDDDNTQFYNQNGTDAILCPSSSPICQL